MFEVSATQPANQLPDISLVSFSMGPSVVVRRVKMVTVSVCGSSHVIRVIQEDSETINVIAVVVVLPYLSKQYKRKENMFTSIEIPKKW